MVTRSASASQYHCGISQAKQEARHPQECLRGGNTDRQTNRLRQDRKKQKEEQEEKSPLPQREEPGGEKAGAVPV